DKLELGPGWGHEKLEGWIPEFASEQEIRSALEKAFDYRGDITITRKDGTKIKGYVFDRRSGSTLADSLVRIYPKDSSQKISIARESASVDPLRDRKSTRLNSSHGSISYAVFCLRKKKNN